jgi:hypothetical protein
MLTVILQAGYAFDESPVEALDRSADLPLDDNQRLTAGVIYKLNTDLALGIQYADLGDPELTASDDPMFSSPNGRFSLVPFRKVCLFLAALHFFVPW